MTKGYWRARPLHTVVVELLERKGALTDTELLELLREVYNNVGVENLNRVLFKLEVSGLIYVSSLARGKRRVELRRKSQVSRSYTKRW